MPSPWPGQRWTDGRVDGLRGVGRALVYVGSVPSLPPFAWPLGRRADAIDGWARLDVAGGLIAPPLFVGATVVVTLVDKPFVDESEWSAVDRSEVGLRAHQRRRSGTSVGPLGRGALTRMPGSYMLFGSTSSLTRPPAGPFARGAVRARLDMMLGAMASLASGLYLNFTEHRVDPARSSPRTPTGESWR